MLDSPMNIVDFVVIVLVLFAIIRGAHVGSVRQIFSTGGFLLGVFAGAWLEPHFAHLAHSQLSKSLLAIGLTLGLGLILMTVAEYLGTIIKHHIQGHQINRVDGVFGAIVGSATLLISVWLAAALITTLPASQVQEDIRGSAIITKLTRALPPAPYVIANLGHLINPNGFPQVFSGAEPTPTLTNLPSTTSLLPAVAHDELSVVKIEGVGCGGIIEGSGFVVAPGFVATNAHVVAGVAKPHVIDQAGQHEAQAIWFDPDLDFAVLRVDNLTDAPLSLQTKLVTNNTPASALGYPGGGNFAAQPAVVLDEFTATGRNIYNQGAPDREIYEIQAHIIPGNSGGPLIAADGSVIGIVFAQSTAYNNVGYALTLTKVSPEIQQAQTRNTAISTGTCAN